MATGICPACRVATVLEPSALWIPCWWRYLIQIEGEEPFALQGRTAAGHPAHRQPFCGQNPTYLSGIHGRPDCGGHGEVALERPESLPKAGFAQQIAVLPKVPALPKICGRETYLPADCI